ncbi:MAG: 16S rRNA (uracil(1498)-N(3))-methyltransferase [Sedimentisphaerales bacterium]|nr:16S rRNA (uracil(1498)-N(3))-methyltransferase [Sedimentisphaerales bacterium]
MNRFFISKSDIRGDEVVLTGQQAHQIRNVLRMTSGERIIVLDNTGCEYEVVLTGVDKQEVAGRIDSRHVGAGEPDVQIVLYQSLLSRVKFELVLQKCTEVGVSRFTPIITQRSVIRKGDTVTPKKLDRWRAIITEAAEQSHRTRIPELAPPVRFDEVLSQLNAFDRCLIASPHEQQISLQKALRGGNRNEPQTIALLIGPEGGFTEEELRLAIDAGALPVSLGPRILRTETAAIVASALILHELEPA